MAFAIKNKKKSREDNEMYVVEKDISKFEKEEDDFAQPYAVQNKPAKVRDVVEEENQVEKEVYEVVKDRNINDKEHQTNEPQPWETRVVAEPRKERISLAQKLPEIKEPKKPGIVKSIESGATKVAKKTKESIKKKYKESDYYAKLKAQEDAKKEAKSKKFRTAYENEKYSQELKVQKKQGKFKTPSEKSTDYKEYLEKEGIDYVKAKKKKKKPKIDYDDEKTEKNIAS